MCVSKCLYSVIYHFLKIKSIFGSTFAVIRAQKLFRLRPQLKTTNSVLVSLHFALRASLLERTSSFKWSVDWSGVDFFSFRSLFSRNSIFVHLISVLCTNISFKFNFPFHSILEHRHSIAFMHAFSLNYTCTLQR